MELKMFIGNQLVDTAPIALHRMHHPAYLLHLRQELEEKNEEILDLSQEAPSFFVDNLPSRMNELERRRTVN